MMVKKPKKIIIVIVVFVWCFPQSGSGATLSHFSLELGVLTLSTRGKRIDITAGEDSTYLL